MSRYWYKRTENRTKYRGRTGWNEKWFIWRSNSWRMERGIGKCGWFFGWIVFFVKNPSTFDAEKYFYKHRILVDRYEAGVVCTEMHLSISSYEGKKDWLWFGKRSRKSPAATSHPYRLMACSENQMSGKVIIDKKENKGLFDLMNRQG